MTAGLACQRTGVPVSVSELSCGWLACAFEACCALVQGWTWTAPQPAHPDILLSGMQTFVCVEPALAASGPIQVQPGETWSCTQVLSVS